MKSNYLEELHVPKVRFFTLINTDETMIGRFKGKIPLQAARKAFRTFCNNNIINNGDFYDFSIKETTRGSDKRIYSYSAKRIELANPIECYYGSSGVPTDFYFKIEIHKNKNIPIINNKKIHKKNHKQKKPRNLSTPNIYEIDYENLVVEI